MNAVPHRQLHHAKGHDHVSRLRVVSYEAEMLARANELLTPSEALLRAGVPTTFLGRRQATIIDARVAAKPSHSLPTINHDRGFVGFANHATPHAHKQRPRPLRRAFTLENEAAGLPGSIRFCIVTLGGEMSFLQWVIADLMEGISDAVIAVVAAGLAWALTHMLRSLL